MMIPALGTADAATVRTPLHGSMAGGWACAHPKTLRLGAVGLRPECAPYVQRALTIAPYSRNRNERRTVLMRDNPGVRWILS